MIPRRLLQAAIILSLLPVSSYAVMSAMRPSTSHDAPTLASVSIQAEGTAAAIPDITITLPDQARIPPQAHVPVSSETLSARVTLSSEVQVQNSGVITYRITSGTLEIGDTDYELVDGTGIFNQHSLVVVLHAATSSEGPSLVLIGHAEEPQSNPGSAAVAFTSPQSKLAGKFFLNLDSGTLTLG